MFRNILITLTVLLASISARAQQQDDGQSNNRRGPPRVGEINEGETTKLTKRIRALRLTSVGLGPYGSSKVDGNPLNYGVSLYKHFEAGVNGEILLGATGAFSGTSTFLLGGVGASYLFSPEDVSPILGAEFGFGLTHYDNSAGTTINESGFAGKINGGVRFFRTSDAQMEVLATYATIFSSSTPSFYGVEVRVLF